MMDAIRHVAQALLAAHEQAENDGEQDGFDAADAVRVAIAALREPAVLEALCRRAADRHGRIGYGSPRIDTIGTQTAAEIVSAVLGAALGEPGEMAQDGRTT